MLKMGRFRMTRMFNMKHMLVVVFALGMIGGLCFFAGTEQTTSQTNGLVILLTDFGLKDFYVGAMKGAIYSVFPEVRIDSISHQITAFDIPEGAYTLARASAEFPQGTVFVVVVDPGVGTPRKPIVMQTEDGKFFVAPDNGILTIVADTLGVAEVRELTNAKLMRGGALSSTFHGRDIFGPTGAHLAQGFPFAKVGPRLNTYVRLDVAQARLSENSIFGRVELIDEYGNALTNIPMELFEQANIEMGQKLRVTFSSRLSPTEFAYMKTYGDVPVGNYLALFGSGGSLEFAINQGNLAKTLEIKSGDAVKLEW